jgi:hypothetical protein
LKLGSISGLLVKKMKVCRGQESATRKTWSVHAAGVQVATMSAIEQTKMRCGFFQVCGRWSLSSWKVGLNGLSFG